MPGSYNPTDDENPGPPTRPGMSSQQLANSRRNKGLYSPDNPQSAIIQAFLDRGMNPYSNNALMKIMLQEAQGLGSAYYVNRGAAGANPESPSDDFASYLSNVLSSGDISGELRRARSNIPSMFNRLNEYESSFARDGGGVLNPLLAGLKTLLDPAQGGVGNLSGLLQNLFSGAGLTRSMRQGLGTQIESGTRGAFTQAVSGDDESSPWYSYLRMAGL